MGHMAVVAAGVHLARARWRGQSVLSPVMGSASMSACRPIARPVPHFCATVAPVNDADRRPGGAQATVNRNAPFGQLHATRLAVRTLLEAQPGWAGCRGAVG